MMDPVEVMKKHAAVPTSLPTVLPDDIVYQTAGTSGTNALW